MRKALTILLVLLLTSPTAFGWGYATHTVVGDELGVPGGILNADEIYGASAPDMFNMAFTLPVYVPGGLYDLTHDHAERIWKAARTPRERALALGFCSHSDVFGADKTAHHDGITYGQGEGYIIAKVDDMRAALTAIGYDLPTALAPLPVTQDLEDEIYHSILEYATDVLTRRIDPKVGARLALAAKFRSPRFPDLVYRTYQTEFDALLGANAKAVVVAVEEEFRQGLIEYGQLLALTEAEILAVLPGYISDFAVDYLAMWGLDLPPGVDTTPLAALYLDVAMNLCAADYEAELEATTQAVEKELWKRRVRIWPRSFRWLHRLRH